MCVCVCVCVCVCLSVCLSVCFLFVCVSERVREFCSEREKERDFCVKGICYVFVVLNSEEGEKRN